MPDEQTTTKTRLGQPQRNARRAPRASIPTKLVQKPASIVNKGISASWEPVPCLAGTLLRPERAVVSFPARLHSCSVFYPNVECTSTVLPALGTSPKGLTIQPPDRFLRTKARSGQEAAADKSAIFTTPSPWR